MRRFLSFLLMLSLTTSTALASSENFSFDWSDNTKIPIFYSPLTTSVSVLSTSRGGVSGSFSRASSQILLDDSSVYVSFSSNTPAVNSSGVLIEPASSNKLAIYSFPPADSYGTTRTAGYSLVLGVKYEIVAQSTLDFTTVGAADNSVGTQFVASATGPLGADDSVKDVLWGVGTKSYWTGSSFQQNIPGITLSGDTASTLELVTDQAEIEAAGLAGLNPTWKVYKGDNSLGVANTFIYTSGVTGNTNKHSGFWYVRGGSGWVGLYGSDPYIAAVSVLSSYRKIKYENITPVNIGQTHCLTVEPGQIIFFVFGQMEERIAVTSAMPTVGATASREPTVLTYPFPTNSKTFQIKFTPSNTAQTGAFLWGSYTSADNYTGALYDGTNFVCRKRIDGTSYDSTKATTLTAGATYDVACRQNQDNTFDIFVNQVKGTANANTTAPVYASTWQIGSDGNGANQVTGQLKNVKTWRYQMTDSYLMKAVSY